MYIKKENSNSFIIYLDSSDLICDKRTDDVKPLNIDISIPLDNNIINNQNLKLLKQQKTSENKYKINLSGYYKQKLVSLMLDNCKVNIEDDNISIKGVIIGISDNS